MMIAFAPVPVLTATSNTQFPGTMPASTLERPQRLSSLVQYREHMSVEIEGLDELEGELEELVNRLEQAGGELPMSELFTPDFMQSYTEFESLRTFMDASPWAIDSAEDFEAIPAAEFDQYVDEHSDFASWDAMLRAAGREYVLREVAER